MRICCIADICADMCGIEDIWAEISVHKVLEHMTGLCMLEKKVSFIYKIINKSCLLAVS